MKFGDKVYIENYRKPYFIAEMNSSHGGNIEIAKQMIDEAKKAGCNCAKFQSWSAETLYSAEYYKENPIAKRFVKKFSLSKEQLKELADYCEKCEMDFASTPYSKEEARFLVEQCHVPFLKIASMDINNDNFLKYLASFGVPLILSTGMSTMKEIEEAVDVLEKAGNEQICILHCVSLYPTPCEYVNLNNLKGLQEKYAKYPIGFSDHTMETEISAAAVAMGAAVIEKHFTLNNTKIGMDNQMAMEPDKMQEMITKCMNVFQAMGSIERVLSEEELAQQKKMRRSVVTTRDIEAGEIITLNDLDVKRPATGLSPKDIDKIIGKRLLKSKKKDSIILDSDLFAD